MKLLLFLNLLMSLLFFSSCAQNRYGIQKTYAYSKESFRGNIPVDEKGNALLKSSDTIRFIFIETKKEDSLIVHAAWNDKQNFSVAVFPVEQKTLEVGKRKTDEKKVIIQISTGNRLWKLELQPLGDSNYLPSIVPQGMIILEGEYKGRIFKLKIKNEVELLPDITG
jgi:hypothetical protein